MPASEKYQNQDGKVKFEILGRSKNRILCKKFTFMIIQMIPSILKHVFYEFSFRQVTASEFLDGNHRFDGNVFLGHSCSLLSFACIRRVTIRAVRQATLHLKKVEE
jgi:hypothetical protein